MTTNNKSKDASLDLNSSDKKDEVALDSAETVASEVSHNSEEIQQFVADHVIPSAVLYNFSVGTIPNAKKTKKKRKSRDKISFDYKNPTSLLSYTTPAGRIISSRISGLSKQEQRSLKIAVKRARHMALLKYTDLHRM